MKKWQPGINKTDIKEDVGMMFSWINVARQIQAMMRSSALKERCK